MPGLPPGHGLCGHDNPVIQCQGIWLPADEEHLLPHIRKNPIVNGAGTYQYAKLQMALKYVDSWRTAIDIGAHVGTFARILANRFQRVEAFEPIPAHRACFGLNVPDPNVVLHPCALGASDGEACMTICQGNSGHTHIATDGTVWTAVRTLDGFGFDDVDFIKIDTEGFELQVLQGAVETLARCKPALMIEQKPNNGSRYGYDDQAALVFVERLGAYIVAQKAGDFMLKWA
jgi:FkbM family methyltransferase